MKAEWLVLFFVVPACSGHGVSVVRPFSAADVWALNESFKTWSDHPPCDLSLCQAGNRMLELYFLGPASLHPFSSSRCSNETERWSCCFEEVRCTSTDDAAAGVVKRLAAPGELVYYMDTAAQPLKEGWLSVLEADLSDRQPVSVYGAEHAYAALWVAEDARRRAVGMSSVYNTSSTLLQMVVKLQTPDADVPDVLSRLQQLYGSTMPEEYTITPLMAEFDGAVATTSNPHYTAAAVSHGGLVVPSGGEEVTVLVRGLSVEKPPPVVAGVHAVSGVPADATACSVDVDKLTSAFFAIASAVDARAVEVPFAAIEEPLMVFRQAANDSVRYDEKRTVYDAARVAAWCATGPLDDSAAAYVAWANVTGGVDADLFELPEWIEAERRAPACRLASAPSDCPCQWPFEWSGKVYQQGQCAFGGGPTGFWCMTDRLRHRRFEWTECEPHAVLSAVQGLAAARTSSNSTTPAEPYPCRGRSTPVWFSVFTLFALVVLLVTVLLTAFNDDEDDERGKEKQKVPSEWFY
jgi:hypothetical protein